MRAKTKITTGVRLVVQGSLPNSQRFIRKIKHKLKQIRLLLMAFIDSEQLCVLLFKCPILRSKQKGGNLLCTSGDLGCFDFHERCEKIFSCINDGDGGVMIQRCARNVRY